MNDNIRSTDVFNLELSASAPRVRITAGLGSAAQKTWNLRRPVTLIGSRRPAHIILHDRDISPAHCVIINTGTEVLLKDLHTGAGTNCNDNRIDLTPLKDGDVITVGANTIQVAIQVPEDSSGDSACGVQFADPTSFPEPIGVTLVHTDQQWEVKDAVVLVGRHVAAPIMLDHTDVSRRHAVIFCFKQGPAVFDLGGQGGIQVNGQQCSLALLSDGDRVTVGPFRLRIGSRSAAELDMQTSATEAPPEPGSSSVDMSGQAGVSTDPAAPSVGPELQLDQDPSLQDGPAAIDSKLDTLQESIDVSWDRLNSWQSQLLEDAAALSKQELDIADRASELDARDAALRGELHDVARYHEQLVERERELAAGLARLQDEKDTLAQSQADFAKREEEVARRAEDLSRREHVFAQRWSRLQSAKCSHCGRPVGNAENGY
ncbi:MAG: FHA domain-containing protein [Phycisphaerales bacterium]|nr:MAG: FHA domain-containing protein [Phycisphaerales bacterium]